jgi:hypothetical protein
MIHLSTDAVEALKELRASPAFKVLLIGLRDAATKKLHDAVAVDPSLRVDATSYARAVCDVCVVMEAIMEGITHRQVVKPGARRDAT